MARLPNPGSDNGTWGNILNDFLRVEHNPDGTLKSNGSLSSKADNSSVVHIQGNETIGGTKTFLAPLVVPAPFLGTHAATKAYVDASTSAGAPDASSNNKGLVQLGGDLSGTAAAPTVPGLATKANTNHTHAINDITNLQTTLNAKESTVDAGAIGDFYRGDKTWQPLNKTVVGLSNVDNTSDASKPISNATQTALNAKVSTGSLAVVATSGSYTDLVNKPIIPAQFNPAAGANISLSGTYPNITISAASGAGPTDLSATQDANTVTVESSTGADATIAQADTTNAGVMSASDKTKLNGVASSATANDTDANLRDRSSHTGTQPIATVSGLQPALDAKAATASLATVATSGSYNDLTNKPTIPTVSDADTTSKGILQLAGDLGGTATAPTVPGLASKANTSDVYTKTQVDTVLATKEPTVTAGTTSQYYRGDKSWQTLDKSAVGLPNVDNTSDANKPVSTATQTALNGKASTTTTITGTNSISGGGDLSANRTLALVNDSATPGTTKYYGTDVSGAKGFFDLPAAGSGTYASLGNKTIGFTGSGADYICDGVNDHVEIQQAINAVTTAGGGVIRFQAGTYDIRSTITVPKNPKIKLQGAYVTKTGFGGTTLKVNSTVGSNLAAIISEAGTSPAVASNADLSHASHYDQLIFDGNDKANVGLLLLNTDHTIVSESKFVGVLIGIDGQYNGDVSQSDYAGGLRVESSSFLATTTNIRLNSHTQDWITNSWFLGGPTTHVELISSNKIHFSNNEFNTVSGQVLLLSDTASLYCGDINVTGGFMNAGAGKTFWTDNRTNTSSKGVIVSGVRLVQGVKTRFFQQAKEFQAATYTNTNMVGGFVTPDFNDQVILLNGASGAINLQLPALANAVQNIWIKAISVTSAVTLTPNGAETIESATTFTFSEVNESVLLSPDATRWRVLENYKPSGGSGGGTAESVVEISSATYTLGTTTDTLLVNASANAVTVTLPAKSSKSTASKKTIVVKVINATNPVTIAAAGSDQIDNNGQTGVVINDTRAVSFVANTGSRWRTYASYDTAIQQRYHDGTSGRLFMTKTTVVNATQTIIADGTGDIAYGIIGTLIVNNAGTVVMQNFSLLPDGSNLDIAAGTSTWRFSVSTLGAFTVIRTAGTGSGTITVNATWQ